MTTKEKEDIVRLQKEGKGYRNIATELDLPLNSVKSWCRRHSCSIEGIDCCLQCGAEVNNTPHKKPRKFCSDACRLLWWKEHPEERTLKTAYSHTCRYCRQVFTNNRSKADYCCRECFAKARTKVSTNG